VRERRMLRRRTALAAERRERGGGERGERDELVEKARCYLHFTIGASGAKVKPSAVVSASASVIAFSSEALIVAYV